MTDIRKTFLRICAGSRNALIDDGLTPKQAEGFIPSNLVDIMTEELDYTADLDENLITLIACAFIRGYIHAVESKIDIN